ncbi:uncharacterized protein BXIN_1992 [Babesia sp. Xinjiang]|uniref:uncharacterized protein n=1 Tax=Babesia sp. Xinjiang TaxID=462227 RepID=UPI000A24DD91|nr:uncharacterized protein BXIN_1992 [Babesia sp. Xinjiang]ORM40394.1 hypothetical protein BXIN_1992 [Babesia sp. Xinjiang]
MKLFIYFAASLLTGVFCNELRSENVAAEVPAHASQPALDTYAGLIEEVNFAGKTPAFVDRQFTTEENLDNEIIQSTVLTAGEGAEEEEEEKEEEPLQEEETKSADDENAASSSMIEQCVPLAVLSLVAATVLA